MANVKDLSIESLVLHADRELNDSSAVAPLIWQTSTFAAESNEEFLEMATRPLHDRFYSRYGNPTLSQVQAVIASVEGTEEAIVTASGMAAISAAVLATVKKGDHVIAQRNHYASSITLMNKILPRFGVETTMVDQCDVAAFERAVRDETRLIYIETPTNPLLQITDIGAIAGLARARGILTAIDNTFAPLNQTPHALGIDLVLHSATKYMGGHCDLIAGAIAGRRELLETIWDFALVLGGALDPFAGWLLLRGLRTLPLRMERHNKTALQVADFLERHGNIERVYYPGLPSHPQHDLARKQMKGFGGVLSFEVKGGFDAAEKVVAALRLPLRAASLGGVESLVVHPAAMWAHALNEEQLREAGVSAGLIRFSVGLEHPADLMADLDQALRS